MMPTTTAGSTTDYFAELRHLENSKLDSHKLTLSVLRAAEESIQKRGLLLSADNYYQALWPLLFHSPAGALKGDDGVAEWHAVILSLAGRFIEDVDITGDRYSELYSGLTQMSLESASVAKSTVLIASIVIRKAMNSSERQESTRELFRGLLLRLAVDPRPKVRKQAHDCIVGIISVLSTEMRDEVAQLIVMAMQESSRRDCQNALHSLPFLKRILPFMDVSKERQQELVQAAGYCLSLGNTHLSTVCYGLLDLLSLSCPVGSQEAVTVMELLRKHQPESVVIELFVPWLIAFSQAAAQVATREAIVYALGVVFEGVQSDRDEILVAGKTAVEHLLASSARHSSLSSPDLDKIAASLNAKINVKRFESFHPATLDICLLTFEAFRGSLLPHFSSTIQLLAMLHDRRGFMMQSAVEGILANVCRWIGVEAFTDLVPLRLIDGHRQKNGWMISVVGKGCFNDYLAVFKSRMMPSAKALLQKAQACRESGGDSEARILETIANQILATLSGFLRFPADLSSHFDEGFAIELANWLNTNQLLRPLICNGLTELIDGVGNSIDDVGADGSGGERGLLRGFSADTSCSCLRQHAPKFLPILFNICLVSPINERSFVLSTIRAMLSVVDPGTTIAYLDRLVARLPSVCDAEQSAALLDIAGAIMSTDIPFVACLSLLALAKQGIVGDSPAAIQKRSYRILSILANREEYAVSLSRDEELVQLLANCAADCDPSARKTRFKVLSSLTSADEDNPSFTVLIPAVLPEVILGTKQVNHQTRQAAFDLTIQWARQFHSAGKLTVYVEMVMAGLAAQTPTMMAATILALARLVFEFHSLLAHSFLPQLLDDAVLILSSPTREVVKAAIGFIKVCVLVIGDRGIVDSRLERIMGGLLLWSHEHTQHFRLRVRHIIERLIRMYGFDRVHRCCPPEHCKLLDNIRQCRERRAKRKKRQIDQPQSAEAAAKKPFDEAMFGEDEEDEILTEDDMEVVKDDEDDIETAMSKKLSLKSFKSMKSLKSVQSTRTAKSMMKSSKSSKLSKTQPDDGFKRNKHGKIIIQDSDPEEVDVDAVCTTNYNSISDADFSNKTGKKQRYSKDDGEDISDEEDRPSRMSKKTSLSRKSILAGAKSKQAGRRAKRGDAIRPGQPEPYAYVPLTRHRNNQRGSNYFMNKK